MHNPKTNILMISGDWDDILTPVAANALYEVISGFEMHNQEVVGDLERGNYREIVVLEKLLHNFEPFSPRVLSTSKTWAREVWGLPLDTQVTASTAKQRITLWVTGFAGILLGVIAAGRWTEINQNESDSLHWNVKILNLKKFLRGKLILWLASIPLILLVMGLVFLIHLNKPVINLIYVGFIGGYGLVLWGLYRWERMPGVSGRLPFTSHGGNSTNRLLAALGISLLLMVITAAFARTGWFYVFAFNERLFWLLIFTPVTALGFWIGINEMRIVNLVSPRQWGPRMAVILIGLVPFFLYAVLMVGIGSVSGLVGGLQGLLVLWLVFASGVLMQNVGRNAWLTALIQSVLLYWLIFPQGVLF